ncbi:tRNA (cytosine(38)-C(5))-methyltransferase-like [Clavelina lepadiformis]|uniref:tRNA (cytosine(38)-C(5))-methyltransferase n=1 Tax=Clavelina lepadiformis TaxID=159417 RepID=A0ABP0H0I4_CLALP
MSEASLRALELYCGIGGMHYALKLCGLENAEVIAAVDISPLSNAVYRHNFPGVLHMEKGIEGLSAGELDRLKFNLLMMSPPCQPFTRVGLKKDIEDPRTKSFLHLLSVLPKMTNRVTYILLENVKGFEESRAYKMFCETLDQLGYVRQGFLLSPKQLGIPNSRQRYYMLAKCSQLGFDKKWYKSKQPILKSLPEDIKLQLLSSSCPVGLQTTSGSSDTCQPLQNFLEQSDSTCENYELSKDTTERYLSVMDIVSPSSTGSTCFTKSYGQYIEGTGSILNLSPNNNNTTASCDRKAQHYKLRYFSPREIANIMCFPKTFYFPETITRKQQYRLLGNSLNVHVVAYLLKLLVTQ